MKTVRDFKNYPQVKPVYAGKNLLYIGKPNKTLVIAANVTYQGITYNTRMLWEYEHTGKLWHNTRKRYTMSETIAHYWKASGRLVRERKGYWYLKRLAIPAVNGSWLYLEPYQITVNHVSKYGKKVHAQLSQEQEP